MEWLEPYAIAVMPNILERFGDKLLYDFGQTDGILKSLPSDECTLTNYESSDGSTQDSQSEEFAVETTLDKPEKWNMSYVA